MSGIIIASLETQASFSTNGLRFTFLRGGPQSLADYRGEDDIVAEASGRDPGQWIADTRELVLHGMIVGTGSTAQAVRESFATRAAALKAVMLPTTLVTVTVHPPNFGLAVGTTAVLSNCRPTSIDAAEPSALWYEGWEVQLHLLCIDSPPEWVIS